MKRSVDLQVMFRVTLQDGATLHGRTLELIEHNGEPDKVMVDGAAVSWHAVAGISTVRVPVVNQKTSMVPGPRA